MQISKYSHPDASQRRIYETTITISIYFMLTSSKETILSRNIMKNKPKLLFVRMIPDSLWTYMPNTLQKLPDHCLYIPR